MIPTNKKQMARKTCSKTTRIVNIIFFNVNNVFQLRNKPSIPHLTVTDKQGIHLKMHEMAILETLIFKNFCRGIPPDPPPPLRNWHLWCSYKHIRPAFGVLKLGVYDDDNHFIQNITVQESISLYAPTVNPIQ